ncbi:GAF domain-containing sensor histidine kinase [Mucilaginibacter aquaedulcis]|uniref:GAF domain-containing sensor histidine kinase n=1 Tax=Mucilaginibacter aquaedulcis TaxID=1187081 RepID=UPI0025B4C644|nr:GAF domain-containing sensor histidine kinase [Mucilaginibacter aquaedulcis]MDN3547842.1 GAF domain-containing sensor histidine kinase [Mucilaginibacter aquaedulcis]
MPEKLEIHFQSDVDAVQRIPIIDELLDIICATTGMGYAAVARVTEDRWIACAVADKINFGLGAGGELKVETTLCHEVRQMQEAVVFDDALNDETYVNHHTPEIYGLRSYISVPIMLRNGQFFGTLCAIDPNPHALKNRETMGMFKFYAELLAFHLSAAEQLAQAEARLEEEKKIAELREQFIAILGHDLRNPVGAVKNVGQLLKRGNLEEDKLHHFAGILQNSSHRMIGLIENIMDFARGRLGSGIHLNKELLMPEPVLQHVINELQLIWPDKTVKSQFELNEPVELDSKRLAQLFSNLLGNALSHGGADEPVLVEATITEGKFVLKISNSGEPIPAVALKNLFHPFSRGDAKAGQEGLGLGLYISSEIVKAHGGTITVLSDEERTLFTVTI